MDNIQSTSVPSGIFQLHGSGTDGMISTVSTNDITQLESHSTLVDHVGRLRKYVLLVLDDERTLIVHRCWISKNFLSVIYPKKYIPITEILLKTFKPDGENSKMYGIKKIISSFKTFKMAAKTLENLLSKNYRPELTSQSYNTNTVFPTSPSPSGVQGSSPLPDDKSTCAIRNFEKEIKEKDKTINDYKTQTSVMETKLDRIEKMIIASKISTVEAKLDIFETKIMEKLSKNLLFILEHIELIKKKLDKNVEDIVNFDEILPKNSKKDLRDFDKKLIENRQLMEQFVKLFVQLNIQDFKIVMNVIFDKIFTKKLGSKISLTGKGKTLKGKSKLPLNSLYLFKIIQSIVGQLFPTIPYAMVNKQIRSWLKKASHSSNKANNNP